MPPVTSYAEGAPAWVDLATSDPAGARVFYGELFGWKFDIGPAEAGFYTYCTLRGERVAGMVGSPVATMPPTWVTYLASRDVTRTAERVAGAGGTILMGPIQVSAAGSVLVATDPGGALVGVWEAGDHPGAAVVGEPGAVAWSELVTPDLDAVTDFYSAVFGHQWDDRSRGNSAQRYRVFSLAGRVAGGALAMPPAEGMPPHWMTYFGAGSVDEVAEHATALGGAVRSTDADSSVGRWCEISDPQGAHFTVLEAVQGARGT